VDSARLDVYLDVSGALHGTWRSCVSWSSGVWLCPARCLPRRLGRSARYL